MGPIHAPQTTMIHSSPKVSSEKIKTVSRLSELCVQVLTHKAIDNPPEMSKDGFLRVLGTETYVDPGKKIHGIALNLLDRIEFFRKYPKVEQMMKVHPENPPLEEGYYSEKKRDRLGEYFLPFESIEKIVRSKVKAKIDHLILVENSFDNLLEQVKAVPLLKEGERILLGYVSEIHSNCGYIEMVQGKLKCLLLDSELPEDDETFEIYDVISKVFSHAEITIVKEELQVDYFSCTTFVIQALIYFAKHGTEMWKNIEKTPAPLLKMSQKIKWKEMSPDTLNEIVSVKKKQTLKEYLTANTVQLNGKFYNLAAIQRNTVGWLC